MHGTIHALVDGRLPHPWPGRTFVWPSGQPDPLLIDELWTVVLGWGDRRPLAEVEDAYVAGAADPAAARVHFRRALCGMELAGLVAPLDWSGGAVEPLGPWLPPPAIALPPPDRLGLDCWFAAPPFGGGEAIAELPGRLLETAATVPTASAAAADRVQRSGLIEAALERGRGSVPGASWPWVEPRSARGAAVFEHFRRACSAVGAIVTPVSPRDAPAGFAGRVAEALAAIEGRLPRLAGSTFSLVEGAGLFEGPIESTWSAATPGLVWLNPSALDGERSLQNALLHESLHEKLGRLQITTALLGPGGATIEVPWRADRSGRATFGSYRALAACHVYVHLALLEAARGDDPGLMRPGAAARADHLGRALLASGGEGLGCDGRALLDWLLAGLAGLAALTDRSDEGQFSSPTDAASGPSTPS